VNQELGSSPVGGGDGFALPLSTRPSLELVGEGAVLDLRHDEVVLELPGGRELAPPALAPARGLLAARPWQRIVKRAIDIVGSVVALFVLLPLLIATALAIALTSRGPILYVQERVGRNGRRFSMLKFRSMRDGADESRGDLMPLNDVEGPHFKMREDPRITPVGRVIRKLSIDELPQLINVLRGEMSLVGPRPPLPEEVVTYGVHEMQRLAVTPGITCIWQVRGRSDLDFHTWVEMDLEYIRNWNLRLDLRLLALTIPAVLSTRGAY
jgi:exopolysaccharide biosynthesis polyprenyl glycosylphosphotransferase